MKLLTKFPVYLKLRSSSKTQFKLMTQSLFNGPNLTANVNYNPVYDTKDTDFPHLKYISEQEKILLSQHIFKKKILATELCEECCIQDNILHPQRICLLNINIDALSNLDITPSPEDVIKNMLSYLEPFPFNMDEKYFKGSLRKKDRKVEGLTVVMIRNSIEKQYLAWKFRISLDMVERILMHLHWSFYKNRSLQSFRRNLELLEQCYQFKKIDLSKQLYLLSQMALNTKILEDFQDNLFGLDWLQIGICYPRLLRKPYVSITSRIKALQEEGFSNEQLMKAFPLLILQPSNLIKILNFFKDLPDIYKYRDDPYFLRLLWLYAKGKLKDYDWSQTSYEDLKNELTKHEKLSKGFSDLIKFPRVTIELYAQIKLGAKEEQLEGMKNNFKSYTYSLKELSDTLLFLQENKFTSEEIIDCITIIFYPRQVIQKVLKTIDREKITLSKLGFVNGHVDRKTVLFQRGSTLKNKTLHLCVYYIQKGNNFSVGQSSDRCENALDQ